MFHVRELKICYKHNLLKAVLFTALMMRPGEWFSAKDMVKLTGAKFTSIHTHLFFWSIKLKTKPDANGIRHPIALLKRKRLIYHGTSIWHYSLGSTGRSWVNNINPDVRKEIERRLKLRWSGQLLDAPAGMDPLSIVSPFRMPVVDSEFILPNGQPFYLRIGLKTIIEFYPPKYRGESYICVPPGAFWTNNVKVAFNVLKNVVHGESSLPLNEIFLAAGLQRRYQEHECVAPVKPVPLIKPAIDTSLPITNNGNVSDVKANVVKASEPIPDEVALEMWREICRKHGWSTNL
jgi:hypothetical protein